MSHKWYHIVCNLLGLIFLTLHNFLEIPLADTNHLCSIPWYDRPMVGVTTHQLGQGRFQFLTIINKTAANICV